ncbi:MAG: histidine kinase [Eubacterium sp.]|nr:histidine kinase [Eubacterium sp.]
MKRKHPLASIQKRILIITLSCILGMCILISSVSYYIFHSFLQKSLMQSTETGLRLLSDTINTSINDVYRLVRYCQTSSDIAVYIENNPNPGSVLSVATYDRLNEEYQGNASSGYMPRVAIVSHDNFLQVVNSTYSSTADLAAQIPELDFFDDLLNAPKYDFSTGFIADPFHRKGRMVLPIIRPITYQYNAKQAGYLFVEISGDLFTTPLKRYGLAEDSSIYLTLGEHNYLYENGTFIEVTPEFDTLLDMSNSALAEDTIITQINNSPNAHEIIISMPLNMTDCYISQSISHAELNTQLMFFIRILLATLIGILAIGVLLMFIMNRMINAPVRKLREKMLRISEGDFSRDSSIEWEHELGEIGRGINDLSENVYSLMNRRLEDEKQKRDLEYQVLQSQINPHFLYNTLNSIKWMATIQGATGISEMTTALSRLLKSISKGTSLLVDIREELSLLENYFTIQSYRYGGTITMKTEVDDEALYNSEIIKFTLQPLVENAIFHGIEPKGSTGTILIHVGYEQQPEAAISGIRIDVTDDGVGMSPQKAEQILQGNSDSRADFFREIGVSNVHKRLQYEFGEEYGITINSVEGEFTTMSIHIPNRQREEI